MLKWLENNYKLILNFCKDKYSDYPEVCDRIVIITSIYLKEKFPNENIKICVGEYKKIYHWWIIIDNKIIDLVKFQFTVSDYEFNNKIFNLDNYNIIQLNDNNYHTCDCLNVEFNDDYFINKCSNIISIARKTNNLNSYLNELKNIDKF